MMEPSFRERDRGDGGGDSSWAGSEDEKLGRRSSSSSLKSPDPCLLCGEPAVHYDWEGNVIKRELSPSRLQRSSGGDKNASSSEFLKCVFKCFRTPPENQRLVGKDWNNRRRRGANTATTDLPLPVCEPCEELVALLLNMYDKVEELEENLRRTAREAERKFVEEELYEKVDEFYGSFREILSVKRRRWRKRNCSDKLKIVSAEMEEEEEEEEDSGGSSGIKTRVKIVVRQPSSSAHSPSPSSNDVSANSYSTTNINIHQDQDNIDSRMECEEDDVGGTENEKYDENLVVVNSCNEPRRPPRRRRPRRPLITHLERDGPRRMSPRRRGDPPPTIIKTCRADEFSSSCDEEESRESDNGSDNYAEESNHDDTSDSAESSSADSESGGSGGDCNRAEEADKSRNSTKWNNNASTNEEMEEEEVDAETPKKTKNTRRRSRNMLLLLNHNKKKQPVRPPTTTTTYSQGLCPVCDKPFESIQSVAYYAHRMSHLSESEKAQAIANPVRLKRGKTRPRIPPVKVKRRVITPELASLRGDVNQCSSCGKFITGGAWALGQHEKLHVPRNEEEGETRSRCRRRAGSCPGFCPVCFKPFQSTRTPKYYDHRLSHLSEVELSEAHANPCKLHGGKTRPRFPRLEEKLRITPELASLRWDVNPCPSCGRLICGGSPGMAQHAKTHLPEEERKKTHLCSTCGKAFTSKTILEQHTRRTHSDGHNDNNGPGRHNPRARCTTRQVKAKKMKEKSSPLLRRDVNQCPSCGKFVCGGRRGMESHAKSHLSPEEKRCHLCPTCGKAYTSKTILEQHTRRTHSDGDNDNGPGRHNPRARCTTRQVKVVKVEEKSLPLTLTSSTFPCSQCNRSFGTAKALKWHITMSHVYKAPPHNIGTGTWACSLCRERFGSREQRLEHYREVHPNSKVSLRLPPPPEPPRCLYPNCDNTGFRDESSLQTHVSQEHPQGPSSKGCTCHLCGRVLVHEWSLQQHLLTHSGEKSHRCHHCNASFRLASTLNGHLAMIHGEGPLSGNFKCEQPGCGRVFQSRIQYGKHMRNVHKIYLSERRVKKK